MGNNIMLPYSSFIHGGVHDGTDVVITGRPNPNFDRFSLNLCSGPNLDSGDVALHFNPRFNQGQVVRNHKQGGNWGAEETAGRIPFRRGHLFTIHMKVHHHGYKIVINNSHFCDFTHRLPKESVQYLYIEGDVTIQSIQFAGHSPHHHPGHHPHHGPPQPRPGPHLPHPRPGPHFPHPRPKPPHRHPYPGPTPGYPQPPYQPGPYPGPGPAAGPIYNPPVPVNTAIPGGFYPGKIIFISGTPYPSVSRFQVNLACGYGEGDLALHFDARFNYGSDHNVVVRTHRQGGNYGPEEKHQNYFPFVPGGNFEMMILCEPNCIKVAVNNQHFTEFAHRIQPISRIDHVQVHGDVSVTQIRFQ